MLKDDIIRSPLVGVVWLSSLALSLDTTPSLTPATPIRSPEPSSRPLQDVPSATPQPGADNVVQPSDTACAALPTYTPRNKSPFATNQTQGCQPNCRRGNGPPIEFRWAQIPYATTITAETVVTIYNRKTNGTRITTITNTEWDTDKFPRPTELNGSGSKTAVVTQGSQITITFPYGFTTYDSIYTVWGQYPTTIDGSKTCVSNTNNFGTTFTFPTQPTITPKPGPAIASLSPEARSYTYKPGDQGWDFEIHTQQIRDNVKPDGSLWPFPGLLAFERLVPPLMPDLPLWQCSLECAETPEPAEVKERAKLLVGSSTAYEDGDDVATPAAGVDDQPQTQAVKKPEQSLLPPAVADTQPPDNNDKGANKPPDGNNAPGKTGSDNNTPDKSTSGNSPPAQQEPGNNAPNGGATGNGTPNQGGAGSNTTPGSNAPANNPPGNPSPNQGQSPGQASPANGNTSPGNSSPGSKPQGSSKIPGSAQPPGLIINSNPIPADSAGNYVLGAQTLTPGGTATASGGAVVSLANNGNFAVVGGNTQDLRPSPVAAALTVGGRTVAANSAGNYIIGDQTLKPGGSVTAAGGAVVALASDGAAAVVGGSTQQLQPAITKAPAALTVGSTAITPNAAGNYIIGDQTLKPGSSVTAAGGTVVALASDGSSAVVGASTQQLQRPTTNAPALTVGASTITPNAAGAYVIGSQTLKPGSSVTLSGGTVVSLASNGASAVIGSSTQQLTPPSITASPVLTIGAQEITADAAGDYVLPGGQTLKPGSSVTAAGGTVVSLASDGQFAIVGTSTEELRGPTATGGAGLASSYTGAAAKTAGGARATLLLVALMTGLNAILSGLR